MFPGVPGSKEAALLVRDTPPHYLLWGDQEVLIAASDNPLVWPSEGQPLLSPRSGAFDSALVQAGGPPLRLSTGDYLYIYNSGNVTDFQPGWAVLNGSDPTQVRLLSDGLV